MRAPRGRSVVQTMRRESGDSLAGTHTHTPERLAGGEASGAPRAARWCRGRRRRHRLAPQCTRAAPRCSRSPEHMHTQSTVLHTRTYSYMLLRILATRTSARLL